ncbi:hypothetical protein VF08_37785 [Nostoc linckia z8]|uniref:Uncharacterized protein n=1 Tax=Nostoc linckia z8 TaxID=1628746 RepID=A0A9Q5Z410_NOSLI|nr:hypothetical protein VF08_37785 [Nostoc linckia z8]
MENSAATLARMTKSITKATDEPGAAVQRRARQMILMTAKKAIQGFRAPDSSAIEPRIGASSAMMTPDIVAALLQAVCALTGSSVMRATK